MGRIVFLLVFVLNSLSVFGISEEETNGRLLVGNDVYITYLFGKSVSIFRKEGEGLLLIKEIEAINPLAPVEVGAYVAVPHFGGILLIDKSSKEVVRKIPLQDGLMVSRSAQGSQLYVTSNSLKMYVVDVDTGKVRSFQSPAWKGRSCMANAPAILHNYAYLSFELCYGILKVNLNDFSDVQTKDTRLPLLNLKVYQGRLVGSNGQKVVKVDPYTLEQQEENYIR